MANININALSNVLATAIQQAATQVVISTPTNITAMDSIMMQPSPSATVAPVGNGELNSSSSTA